MNEIIPVLALRRSARPEQIGHSVKLAEIEVCTKRIHAVEADPAVLVKQFAAQRLLQMFKALIGLTQRNLRRLEAARRPSGLNPADPLNYHCVVIAVRPAVERQTDPHRRRIVGRKQQSVAAKIIEIDPFAPQCAEQPDKAAARKDLARQ